jgi:ABC-type Fe3+-siderophore transport system permease subunit
VTSYDLPSALIGAVLLLLMGWIARYGEPISRRIQRHTTTRNDARGNQ